MGLGAPRKRRKISHDPNNNTWCKSTTNYGHQYLVSQGWKPNTNLGAINSSYAHLHSKATASHIRVAFREDNLGLGAKVGGGQRADECVGLDAFQGLLGRLNGKSEATLEIEQKSRDRTKQVRCTEQRWGLLRFVRGGLLVGNKIEELAEEDGVTSALISGSSINKRRPVTDENYSKKITEILQSDEGFEDAERAVDQCGADSRKHSLDSSLKCPGTSVEDKYEKEDPKEGKGRKKGEKARLKLERKQKRKAEKLRGSDGMDCILPDPLAVALNFTTDKPIPDTPCGHLDNNQHVTVSTASGRQAVRQRYIRQKKLALMDPKALNEILMIKS